MVSFVNFARIASICVRFHVGTLHGYFFHRRQTQRLLAKQLNFPLEYKTCLNLQVLWKIVQCQLKGLHFETMWNQQNQ